MALISSNLVAVVVVIVLAISLAAGCSDPADMPSQTSPTEAPPTPARAWDVNEMLRRVGKAVDPGAVVGCETEEDARGGCVGFNESESRLVYYQVFRQSRRAISLTVEHVGRAIAETSMCLLELDGLTKECEVREMAFKEASLAMTILVAEDWPDLANILR